jgi:hypothetical protein
MHDAMRQFNSNLKVVREMDSLYNHLVNDLRLPNDLSDILRAELVYAVSALDKLVHELVRIGMRQAFTGSRQKTSKFNAFPISLDTHHKIQQAYQRGISQPESMSESEWPVNIFEQEIILKHQHLSFQEPEKIADALSLIWEEKQKWQKIALPFNRSDDVLKKTLKLIVQRRNQIVHEADIYVDPIFPMRPTNKRNEIEATDVQESVEFISKLGESIFNAVKLP